MYTLFFEYLIISYIPSSYDGVVTLDSEITIRTKKTLEIISKNIKHFRILKNMSQIELGLRADITPSYITAVETRKHDLLVSTLVNIAYALDIPIYELFIEREVYLSKSRVDGIKK